MKNLQNIAGVLASISDPEEMQSFLNEILTKTEQEALSLRWQLLKLLDDGVSQRTIARQLGVSLCKITRGAKILKQPDSLTRKFLQEPEIQEPEVQEERQSSEV